MRGGQAADEGGPRVVLSRAALDAVIFDMDGVVTRTASLHEAAWKETFDAFLRARLAPAEPRPFDERDYLLYVDGKPRYDGVASFLASRGIALPFGRPEDAPDTLTVCGLGNRKDAAFHALLAERGVEVFPSTIELLHALRLAGFRTGIFTASRNAEAVLAAAGVRSLFDARVDGNDAAAQGLAGKPAPATLLALTRLLGATPGRTAVVEDAIAGVEAGRAGGFALVIGVNRSGDPGALLANGADVEVSDLGDATVQGGEPAAGAAHPSPPA